MASYTDLPTEIISNIFDVADLDDVYSYSMINRYHKLVGDRIIEQRYASAYRQLTFPDRSSIIKFTDKLRNDKRIAKHPQSLVYTGNLQEQHSDEETYIFVFPAKEPWNSHRQLQKVMMWKYGVWIGSSAMRAHPQEFAFCALLVLCPTLKHIAVNSIPADGMTAKVLGQIDSVKRDEFSIHHRSATNLLRIELGQGFAAKEVRIPREIRHMVVWPRIPKRAGHVALREMENFQTMVDLNRAARDQMHAFDNIEKLTVHIDHRCSDPYMCNARWWGLRTTILQTVIVEVEWIGELIDWEALFHVDTGRARIRFLRVGGDQAQLSSLGFMGLRRIRLLSDLVLLDLDERILAYSFSGFTLVEYIPHQLEILKIKNVTEAGAKRIFTLNAVDHLRRIATELKKMIISTDDDKAREAMEDVAQDLGVELVVVSTEDDWKPAEEL